MPKLLALLSYKWNVDVDPGPLDWLQDVGKSANAQDMRAIADRIEDAAERLRIKQQENEAQSDLGMIPDTAEARRLQLALVRELVTLRALVFRFEDKAREEASYNHTKGLVWVPIRVGMMVEDLRRKEEERVYIGTVRHLFEEDNEADVEYEDGTERVDLARIRPDFSSVKACLLACARCVACASRSCLPCRAWTGSESRQEWPMLAWLASLALFVVQTYAQAMALVMMVAIFIGTAMAALLFIMSNLDSKPGSSPLRMPETDPNTALKCVLALPIGLFLGWLCIYNAGMLLVGQACGVSFARCRALFLGSTSSRKKNHRWVWACTLRLLGLSCEGGHAKAKVFVISIVATLMFSYLPQAAAVVLLSLALIRMVTLQNCYKVWTDDWRRWALVIIVPTCPFLVNSRYGVIVGAVIVLLFDVAERVIAAAQQGDPPKEPLVSLTLDEFEVECGNSDSWFTVCFIACVVLAVLVGAWACDWWSTVCFCVCISSVMLLGVWTSHWWFAICVCVCISLAVPAGVRHGIMVGSTHHNSLAFPHAFKAATFVWGSAVIGAWLWASANIFFYILGDIFVGKDQRLRAEVLAAETAMKKYDIAPGCPCAEGRSKAIYRWMVLDAVMRAVIEQRSWERSYTRPSLIHSISNFRWCRRIAKKRVVAVLQGLGWDGGVLIVVGLCLLLLISLAMVDRLPLSMIGPRDEHVFKLSIVLVFQVVCILFYARLFYKYVGGNLSWLFYSVLLVVALLMGRGLGLGLKLKPLFQGKPVPMPRVRGAVRDAWVWENTDFGQPGGSGRHPPYSSCLTRWGAHEELRLLDLAILASYSYDPDSSSYSRGGDVWTNTSKAFDGDGLTATVLEAQPYWAVGRLVVFRFTSLRGHPQRDSGAGTTVLVVKGSSEAFDFYADAGLWAMICSFQAFMIIVPLLDQLPNQIFAWLLESLPRTPMERHIFSNIRDVHAKYSKIYTHDAFLVTGHSLGGGIAIAAGGSLGIPAVGFSGPGSHFSRWRFNTSQEGAYRTALDVKPEIDFVHKIDRHDEASQYIACRDANGDYRDAATCHSIGTTVCELWRACGDHRRRSFAQMCHHLFNNTELKGRYLGRPLI